MRYRYAARLSAAPATPSTVTSPTGNATAASAAPVVIMSPMCWYLNGSNGRSATAAHTFQAT